MADQLAVTDRRPVVGVFRNTHLLPSEPFIADQAAALSRWRPVLLGRDAVARPEAPDVLAIADRNRLAAAGYRGGVRRAATPFLRSAGVDLVHAHFGVDAHTIRPAARAAGLPLVVTLHGFDVTLDRGALLRSGKPAWLSYALGRRRLLRAPDITFVAVSEHIAECAVRLGADASRITVVPTGVDTAAIEPSPMPEDPRVVHVARLVEKKGTRYLLQAFARVVDTVADARLDIVGDGPLRAELEALATVLGIADRVTFHGVRTHAETVATIRAGRVLSLPSVTASTGDQEGLGQVMLEAMALGRSVVASRSGGIPEVVRDGATGWLVAERAVPDLAAALTDALTSPRAGVIARAGRELVASRFDVRFQAARLESVYDLAWGAA